MTTRKYISWIVLLAAMLACSNLPFGETGSFEDDFSNSSSGWPDSRDADSFTGYQNGSYRILVTTSNFDVWVTPGENFSDVIIEVQATKIGGDDDNDFGVICRAENLDNFYAGIISSDGFYGIFQNIDSGELALIGMDQMLSSDAINQGDATNQLRFECIGDTISLYVNGTLVAQVEDSNLTSGDIGLMAGTYDFPGTDILFDNMTAKKP